MREEKRIYKLMTLIFEIWSKNPDLRLFQLLGNPFPPEDHYYLEDDILETRLREYYNEERSKNT